MSNQASAVPSDFLIGAAAIAKELKELGLIENADEDKVYYIARTGKLPIGKFGKSLIATRSGLRKTASALVA